MSANSDIEWTDATWSPTLGCDKVSPGCTHCYAINTAYRQEFAFKRPEYQGLTRKLPDGSVNWTGQVAVLRDRIALPLHWKTPRRIFVDSMSDLFHEDVPDEFIDQVFGAMALADWHIFQVLTKRPARMLASLQRLADKFVTESPFLQAVSVPGQAQVRTEIGWATGSSLRPERTRDDPFALTWPLPNVWLGVSVEDQQRADERIPLLLQTPAAVRFLSCEPLLGPVDLLRWLDPHRNRHTGYPPCTCIKLGWVIAGGESGPNFRPMDLDWARSLRDQCKAAGVAFHFKQVGGRTHAAGGRELDGREWSEFPVAREAVLA